MSNGLHSRYPVYAELIRHQQSFADRSLLSLFEDKNRVNTFTPSACGLTLDISKHFVDSSTLDLFDQLIAQCDLSQARQSMFAGDVINHTEKRKVLHTTLRSPNTNTDEEKAVHQALTLMEKFVTAIHQKQWFGYKGKAITDVVNIGIGGSDLGPRMVCEALTPYKTGAIESHFVANIDGADIANCLAKLNPDTTLFIIASKSFSTLETLENGKTARTWLLQSGCTSQDVGKHFVAITANVEKAVEFGIEAENCFPMWDWVGGRYSLWSAIGLPIALSVGIDNFKKLLSGANAMDEHFFQTETKNNLPILQALLVFWYQHFWGARSQAILPYNHDLGFFPAYLQQLEMESLGKQCDRDGKSVDYQTGLVVWGTEGTNGQHSFHQLLHQGTQLIPADFIISKKAHHTHQHQHHHLVANCLAQSQALMCGKTLDGAKQELLSAGKTEDEALALAAHKVIPGNRPSTTILLDELNPTTLGALIAMYEHKVFVLSVLYNLNAFDQWGVELGKQLSGPIFKALTQSDLNSEFDPSTRYLVERLK